MTALCCDAAPLTFEPPIHPAGPPIPTQTTDQATDNPMVSTAGPALIDIIHAYERADTQFMQRWNARSEKKPEDISDEQWARWTLKDPPDALVTVNRQFDAAAKDYISNDYAGAVVAFEHLIVTPPQSASFAALRVLARSLHVDIDPDMMLVAATRSSKPTIHIHSLYPVAAEVARAQPPGAALPSEMVISVKSHDYGFDFVLPLTWQADGNVTAETGFDASRVVAGTYHILAVGLDPAPAAAHDPAPIEIATWTIMEKPFATLEQWNVEDSAKVKTPTDETRGWLEIWCERNKMMTGQNTISPTQAAIADHYTYYLDSVDDLIALIGGKNPYQFKVHDYWRPFMLNGNPIPARIYVAKSVEERRPMPVIIALHCLGGNENMWLDGYGGGEIKNLAEKYNMIVVSPQVNLNTDIGSLFDSILSGLILDYNVDLTRVYVIGHSLGGIGAATLARERPDRIAAAAALAGAEFVSNNEHIRIAPTLVWGAQIDQIVPAEHLKQISLAAQAQGQDIEYREIKDFGHMLMVGPVLPDAVDWLMKHQLKNAQTDNSGFRIGN